MEHQMKSLVSASYRRQLAAEDAGSAEEEEIGDDEYIWNPNVIANLTTFGKSECHHILFAKLYTVGYPLCMRLETPTNLASKWLTTKNFGAFGNTGGFFMVDVRGLVIWENLVWLSHNQVFATNHKLRGAVWRPRPYCVAPTTTFTLHDYYSLLFFI